MVDTQENHYPLNREDFSFKMDEKNIHFDVVFNAIHGAPEDGQLAEILDQLYIPHTSCSQSIAALTFNKLNCLKRPKNGKSQWQNHSPFTKETFWMLMQ